VDKILRDLLFDPDTEDVTVERALDIFEPVTDNDDDSVTFYRVHIRNIKLFKLVIGTVSLGASFRLTARLVSRAREELSLGFLGGCNEAKVSSFVRVAAAAFLQKLGELLSSSLAFAIAFDSATVESTSYFDVRARFVKGTSLHYFHLFSLPLYGPHTGDLMFSVFDKAMDEICPSWGTRFLITCSDGDRNLTGRVREIVTRIAVRVAEQEGTRLIRFWCGAQQLDLVVQRVVSLYYIVAKNTTRP
jgi:hypothetical protein